MYSLIDYNSNYSKPIGILRFYSKDEAPNFNADVANDNNFKPFGYKARLLGKAEADGPNGIPKNIAIPVPLKYLGNFWRPVRMPLINCKIELKLRWTKRCVLLATGADNVDANSNNIILTIKDTKLYVPVVTLS